MTNKQQKWQQKQQKREYKLYVGEMKATNDAQGIVEGYLSTFNNIDYGNDRVMPGAFKRTLNNAYERKKADGDDYLWPYLWNHDYDLIPPGGIFDANEDKTGLYIKAQLNLDYQLGRDMYSAFKAKMLKKQSMGYISHQQEYVKEDNVMVRNLIEEEILEGSGVVFPMNDLADVTGVKRQQNGLYVPKYWPGYSSSNGKGKPMNGSKTATKEKPQEKDFNDRYRQQVISDWCYSDWQNLVIALKQSVQDIFAVGDMPSTDLVDIILNDSQDGAGFISALKAYVQEGIDLDYANYLQEQNQSPYGDSYYDYMSRSNPNLARKAGAAFSQDNTDAIHGHVAALHDMADAQAKAMHGAADGLLEALQGLGAPSDPSYRQQGTTADDEKSRRARASLQGKASEADRQVIGQHATDLHAVADTIHQMAEDLAENTGAQTYVDANGDSDNAKETDKDKSNSRSRALGQKHSPDKGTADDSQEALDAALASLAQLHETL